LGSIFVSYRRSDSQGEAGRLFDDLVKHFGEQLVFMDVAGIEAGRDFRKAIEESVAKCGVLLVVMGPEWVNAKTESGTRRLDDPADFVRIETGSALKRDIPVIPVLVHGAEMPRAEQLPQELKDLVYRNCIELTHARWKSDIQLLVEALRRLLGDAAQIGTRRQLNPVAASARPEPRHQELTEPSKLEDEHAARIDPAVMQLVSRELALHIGPIADIVVRRASSHCSSIEDLYLQVAEEIDSPAVREKFLQKRAQIHSAPLPLVAGTTTPPSGMPETSESPSTSERLDGLLETTLPARVTERSGRRKYWLLICGAAIFLIATLVLAARFAAPRGVGSSQTAPTPRPESPGTGSVPVKAVTPLPLSESSSKADEAKKSAGATSESGPIAPQRIQVPQEVSLGLLVKKVLPDYPPLARQAHIQGTVVLEANISKYGTVESLQAISGHPMLVPAAIEAVKQWQYKPYLLHGEAVAIDTQVVVNFSFLGR
jgi:TonB family protein